jgi:hypothetical protein
MAAIQQSHKARALVPAAVKVSSQCIRTLKAPALFKPKYTPPSALLGQTNGEQRSNKRLQHRRELRQLPAPLPALLDARARARHRRVGLLLQRGELALGAGAALRRRGLELLRWGRRERGRVESKSESTAGCGQAHVLGRARL